ncbi:MAG: HAD family phosphatase, partial [Clostridia bacterium]|nr:HAD family phosphatase [Clostridia bacterium]
MAIRLVALDMDGTLLNSRKELPPDFLPWVREHPGILTVIGSGRAYGGLQTYFSTILPQMIFLCDNGAMVFRENRLLFTQPMPLLHVRECLSFVSRFPFVVPVVSSAGSDYVLKQRESEWLEIHGFYAKLTVCGDLVEAARQDPVAKIALYLPEGNAEQFSRELDNVSFPVSHAVSGRDWIDLMEPGVNKGTALREVMRRMQIDRGEGMAFGDYMNDMEMLESVEFS